MFGAHAAAALEVRGQCLDLELADHLVHAPLDALVEPLPAHRKPEEARVGIARLPAGIPLKNNRRRNTRRLKNLQRSDYPFDVVGHAVKLFGTPGTGAIDVVVPQADLARGIDSDPARLRCALDLEGGPP